MTEPETEVSSRRNVLKNVAIVSAAASAGVGGTVVWERFRRTSSKPPQKAAASPTAPAEPKPTGHAPITWAVETSKKLVALTFDDGPVPNCTPLVLDALDEADIKATFFLVGQRLKQNPHIIEGGRLDRHEVGNHTWSHKDLSLLDFQGNWDEISKGHNAIVEDLGITPKIFRPPYGHIGTLTLRAADRFGYDFIMWSQGVTESEFKDKPESVIPYVVDNMVPGTIFLAHDAVAPGVEPAFLKRIGVIASKLRAEGYEFVTVSELMAQREKGLGLPKA